MEPAPEALGKLFSMRIADHGLLRSDGVQTTLYELAHERSVALVFLRHLGCVFCREQVAALRDALPSENVAFVTMASPARSERFRKWMRSPHPFFSDAERRLYRAFHVGKGPLGSYFSPHLAYRGLKAYRSGFRNAIPREDALQLGGTFVIDRDGGVLGAFPATDAGDHPSPESLRVLLASSRESI